MAKLSIKETLDMLLKIQDIDVQLAELNTSKIFYPTLLEELRGEIETMKGQLEETKNRNIDLQKEIDLKNLEIKESNEKLSKGQQRLLSVKSNKEYDAVQREIQASQENIAQLEEETIRLLEELDETTAREKSLAEELEKKGHSNSIEIEEIEKKFAEIEGKASKIQRQRDEYAAKIDKKILARYEMISKGTGGHAVAIVTHRACGGCFQALPPKVCQTIKKRDSIVICEACGRILVWDDEISP
ncbi:hypothetical protein J7L01_02125 [bacterium]|nr:hypothetical protein [bacterium]